MNKPATADVSRETITLAVAMSDETIEMIGKVRAFLDNEPEKFVVKNQADYSYLVELIKRIKSQGKKIEEARVLLVTPFLETKKAIDADFKEYANWQSEQETKAKSAMRKWDQLVQEKADREQAKADAKARIKEQKLREKAEEAADKGDIEKAQNLDEQANASTAVQHEGVVKTEGVARRFKYDVAVTDRKAFIVAAMQNPVLAACLDINVTELKKLAKMLDDEFDFPGVASVKTRDYSI